MMISLRGQRRLQVVALFTFCLLAAPASAQEVEDDGQAEGTDLGVVSTDVHIDIGDKTIWKVEEDWLIDVAVTDERSTAPEIVTAFGPADPRLGLHSVFEMNHSTYPSFIKGGMQLQAWWGGWFLGAKRHLNSAELLTTVERIQFTCVTRVSSGRLTMEVRNGDSVTYGQFGNDGSLRMRLWTDRSNLNNYNPSNSLNHSRVTFGANRVNRYMRTEIRFYATDGTVLTDETDRYVHQLSEANQAPAPVNE